MKIWKKIKDEEREYAAKVVLGGDEGEKCGGKSRLKLEGEEERIFRDLMEELERKRQMEEEWSE